MNKKAFAVAIAITTFCVGVLIAKISLRSTKQVSAVIPPLMSGYELSGPYCYKNLTIFLIHGSDESDRLYVPLQEALERKQVIVYETKEVNQLAIENLSTTDEVLVQAGDIVKGGQQDRVLAVDLIVPTRSGKIPIDAFCVENGRWQQRGAEQVDQFTLSTDMIPTKELKLATKADPHQGRVWQEVAQAQMDLRRAANTGVAGVASPSSMQLSLENQKVQDEAADYLKNLLKIVDGKDDVIGYAFAINEVLNSADVYPSSTLFKRFWPKLLKASAIEALGKSFTDERRKTVSCDEIMSFFADAEQGREFITEVTDRTHMLKRESDKSVFFETLDMSYADWVHRNYLTR
jgi:ARG and Rhodanese-Phosphatase-superfamily-associated Protein domain